MLKKDIKYADFNGVEREESYYFNLSSMLLNWKQRKQLRQIRRRKYGLYSIN